jgi:2-polyprenyl-6-methoxyphenol hydroxylase-like FAD-dependent oxidoreductase
VAIAGAGLSGLCLAQALQRAGFDVRVYERDPAPDIRRQGYRLTIDRYGAAALRACLPPQLFAAVWATASAPADVAYFRLTNRNLGEVFRLTFRSDPGRAVDRPIGQVDRATLRAIMLSGLEDRVHFGKAVERAETTANGAILHFADGGAERVSMVVGADGIHSAIRRHLLRDVRVSDSGFRGIYGRTLLRTVDGESVVPTSLSDSGVLAVGDAPGRSFFFTSMRFNEPPETVFARLVPDQRPPVSTDYVMWAVMLPKEELPADLWSLAPQALHGIARAAARDYHPVLRRLVHDAEVEYTVATALSSATRPTDWPASHVTLMGDAVHVMPPTGAHGGNTALRDAALLADRLQAARRDGASVQQAIGEYQREMIAYAFREVENSVAMLRRNNVTNPLARFAMLRLVPWVRSLVRQSPAVG